MKKKVLIIFSIILVLLIISIMVFFGQRKSDMITITVIDNINSSPNLIEIKSGSTIKDIEPEEKENHKFVKWTGSDGNTIEENKVLIPTDKIYAVYEPINTNYKFTIARIPAQTSKMTISDKKILSVTEEYIPGDPNVESGLALYEYRVIGLEEGEANITIDLTNTDGSKASSTTYYFKVDSNLNVNFIKKVENKITSVKKDTKYSFTIARIPQQTSKISISNKKILSVTEERIPGDPNMETGLAVYEYTISGLKAGEANITIDLIKTDGSKVSSTTYYFKVDSNLNVKFVKKEENKITPVKKGTEYSFTEGIIFSYKYQISVSNNAILSVTDKKLAPEDPFEETGGAMYEFTFKGLKAGKANVTIDIVDYKGMTKSSTTYYFTVDSNLNVKFESSICKFTLSRIPSQKSKIINSDEKILSITEKELPGDPNMVTGLALYEYTVKGLKAGEANISIELINSDGSKDSTEYYYFNVSNDLRILLY